MGSALRCFSKYLFVSMGLNSFSTSSFFKHILVLVFNAYLNLLQLQHAKILFQHTQVQQMEAKEVLPKPFKL